MAIFTSFLYVYWRLPGGFTSIRLHPVSLAPARCPMTSMSLIGSGQRRGTLQWKLWFNQDFNGDVIWFHGIYSWFMIAKLNRIPITRAARVDRRYIMIYLYSCHDLWGHHLLDTWILLGSLSCFPWGLYCSGFRWASGMFTWWILWTLMVTSNLFYIGCNDGFLCVSAALEAVILLHFLASPEVPMASLKEVCLNFLGLNIK